MNSAKAVRLGISNKSAGGQPHGACVGADPQILVTIFTKRGGSDKAVGLCISLKSVPLISPVNKPGQAVLITDPQSPIRGLAKGSDAIASHAVLYSVMASYNRTIRL